VGRLRRRAAKAVVRLLILDHSNAKTGEAWTLPIFACSQPILVKTRSVKDLIRGSLKYAKPLLGVLLVCGGAHAAEIHDTLEQRVKACAICHGEQGQGIKKTEYYPRLAGKPAGYLYNQLINFRERRRNVPIMTYMVAYLSDEYLREIAEYYSKLAPHFPPPAPGGSPATLAHGEALARKGDPSRGIPACVSCHGQKLSGMEPAIPGIVGLNPQYIGSQLGAWRNRTRHAKEPDCMGEIALRLAPGDISAVAAWLTAQPASTKIPPEPANSLKPPIECGSIAQAKTEKKQ
jgi:cytochrome c553